ncbi:hypothetical protein F5883DRAFT_588851, partial [Diaporthe sp. PMI_573]
MPTQVPSPEDCLHGFTVALEVRAKAEEWPEHEELAALTTAEIGEEGRKKVMGGKHVLAIGKKRRRRPKPKKNKRSTKVPMRNTVDVPG